uniref:Uncharacterized protein n=1 Tax=Parascaris equorum TaxID=6256 RepID=A0A914RUJ3_PAREQ
MQHLSDGLIRRKISHDNANNRELWQYLSIFSRGFGFWKNVMGMQQQDGISRPIASWEAALLEQKRAVHNVDAQIVVCEDEIHGLQKKLEEDLIPDTLAIQICCKKASKNAPKNSCQMVSTSRDPHTTAQMASLAASMTQHIHLKRENLSSPTPSCKNLNEALKQ